MNQEKNEKRYKKTTVKRITEKVEKYFATFDK